jgi:polar amino acid transport system substrate-binding protein
MRVPVMRASVERVPVERVPLQRVPFVPVSKPRLTIRLRLNLRVRNVLFSNMSEQTAVGFGAPSPTGNMRTLAKRRTLAAPLFGFLPLVLASAVVLGSCASGDVADLTLASQEVKTEQSSVTFLKPKGDDPDCVDAKESYAPTPPEFGGFGPGETQSPRLDEIRKRGYLIAGVDQDTYLFGYRSPQSKEIEGLDIDVLKAVTKRIFASDDPKHLRLKAIKYADRIGSIVRGPKNNGVDIVADTFTMNCARWSLINFSSQYFDAAQKILVLGTSSAKGLADLSGKKVCAAKGSTSVDNIRNGNPAVLIVEVADQTDCLLKLQSSQIDAISTDDTILLGLAAQDPTLKLLPDAFSPEPYGLGLPKDDRKFTRFVNAVLEEMRANGEWKTLYTKWIGSKTNTVAEAPPAKYRSEVIG